MPGDCRGRGELSGSRCTRPSLCGRRGGGGGGTPQRSGAPGLAVVGDTGAARQPPGGLRSPAGLSGVSGGGGGASEVPGASRERQAAPVEMDRRQRGACMAEGVSRLLLQPPCAQSRGIESHLKGNPTGSV